MCSPAGRRRSDTVRGNRGQHPSLPAFTWNYALGLLVGFPHHAAVVPLGALSEDRVSCSPNRDGAGAKGTRSGPTRPPGDSYPAVRRTYVRIAQILWRPVTKDRQGKLILQLMSLTAASPDETPRSALTFENAARVCLGQCPVALQRLCPWAAPTQHLRPQLRPQLLPA